MLDIQFKHKYTDYYGNLTVGDIFTCSDIPGKVFIYTDMDSVVYNSNNCIDLSTGNAYNFSADTPILIIKNAKLIVEEE